MATSRICGIVLGLGCTLTLIRPAATAPWEPVGLSGGGYLAAPGLSPLDTKLAMVACDMSANYISRDGGRTWEMIHHGQLQSCITCPPVFDPGRSGVIYAVDGRDNSLRISRDSGKSWVPVETPAPWQRPPRRLWLDHTNFFVGTENELWRSSDEFKTWQRCSGIAGDFIGICSDRSREGVYAAATSEGVFVSTDGGETFHSVSQSLPHRKITAFAGASNRRETMLYAAVECRVEDGKLTGGVFASRDFGATWDRVMNPGINVETKRSSPWANGDLPQYRFLRASDRLPERVYVHCSGTSYEPPNHCTVYRSDNGGGSWRAVFFSDPRFRGSYNVEDDRLSLGIGQRYQEIPSGLEINPSDPDVLMMTTEMSIFMSRDGGETWQVSQDNRPATFGDKKAWPCGGLTVTTAWNYYIDPFDPQRHYICYTDLCLARSLDAGKTWLWTGTTPWKNTTYELAFDPAVPGRVWGAFSETHDIPNNNIISGHHRVIMQGGVAASADHGETWEKLPVPRGPCVSIVLDPSSPPGNRTLYAAVFEKGVYKSTDDGKSWVLKSSGLGTETNRRCCKLILHRDRTLFCLVTAKNLGGGNYDGDGPGIYQSKDGAETWKKINETLPLHWPKDFAVSPKDSGTLLVGAANLRGHDESGLYRTRDGGATWTRLAKKGPEHFGAAFHPDKPTWIYMTLCEGAGESGLYLSRDDGATWVPFSTLPFANIMRVFFDPSDPSKILLATFGSSVLRGPAEP